MHRSARLTLGAVALAIVALPTTAQLQTPTFPLTVDSIMRGPALVGYPPSGLRWSGDSSKLYFEWRHAGEDDASTWVVGREGGEPHKLNSSQRKDAPPVNGVWDHAHRRVLFADEGDIAIVDTMTGKRRQVTRTTGSESNPRWARHDAAVTFVRDNNLFLVPLDDGAIEQLTDIAPRKRDARETDSQKFIKTEEEKLIEHTRLEAERKKERDDKKKASELPKYELADRQSAPDLQLAADGKHVFIVISERSDAAKRPNVPNYVTDSSYTEDIPARTFVGDAQDKRSLVVMNIETGKTVPVDAAFAGKRSVRWNMPKLDDEGTIAVAHARADDNKDRWLVVVDPETGKTRVLDALHDDAWVREVGGGFGSSEASYGFVDARRVWFLSERDGWMHLYTVDASAQQPAAKQLTEGKWEIESVVLSRDRSTFYITSSEQHPGERHLYAMSIDGGARTKITSMAGSNVGEVSPDGTTVGMLFSYSNKPTEVYVMANTPGAPATQVTTSTTAEWRSFKWIDPKLITYTARDGAEVYARLYTPEMVGAKRDPSAPAVVFVHGAGYLQNAHKYWAASYYHEYMFNNLLASKGFVVLDPDYRASAGYGRDWRTAIYRHMGGKDLDDVVDGAKYLVEREHVNAKRIGVYGGSYGGFITLMAMFTSPDTFAAGAANRPVTDWSHYNHQYTASILNEPQNDPEAYRQSSPIYFADGLKGALLINHGMVDTNVLFQDTVRLAQRLIELRKENWWVSMYPVENHGFEEETSWADEYKRILQLFEQHLKGHDARRAS
jgi:dipeptidyl aminopeptidase/acylaminoacyl peptidase